MGQVMFGLVKQKWAEQLEYPARSDLKDWELQVRGSKGAGPVQGLEAAFEGRGGGGRCTGREVVTRGWGFTSRTGSCRQGGGIRAVVRG